MRVLVTLLVMLAMNLPALAQSRKPIGSAPTPDPSIEVRKRQDAADLDRAYKAATESVPAASVKQDPWGGIREADPGKTKKK